MLKKILLAILVTLLVVVAVFVGLVAMQPSEYRVSRTVTIAAPPSEVFEQVNDFHKWEAWSPWAKLDPDAKMNYEGPTSGIGAVCTWVGNDKVGEGSMTIVDSRPNELIRIKLEFVKPLAGIADSEFTFKPQGNQTEVTWTMSGKNGFMGKAFCLFMDMDKTLGGEFEKGLASMKTTVESANK